MLYFKHSKGINVFGLASILPIPTRPPVCDIPMIHAQYFLDLKKTIVKEEEGKRNWRRYIQTKSKNLAG